MWQLKVTIGSENTVLAKLAGELDVRLSGYPINQYETQEGLIVQGSGFVEGDSEDIAALRQAMRNRDAFLDIYIQDAFVIASVRVPRDLSVLYNPDIIFVRPQIYTREGTERLEIASWEKEPLSDVLAVLRRLYDVELRAFEQGDVTNVSMISMRPQLTEKQRRAMELAVDLGYYDVPKKITLDQLAEKMGVSSSTYRAHLAKAERDFIPAMFDKFS